MKQKLILLISIISGLLAFWLTGNYLRNERAKIMGSTKMIWVVAAATDMPAGTIIKQTDLGKMQVDQKSVGNRAILPESWKDIVGKKLLFSINRNEPIQWSDVDVPYKGKSGLAEMLNTSMRAISISVDSISSVSGMIKPNDRVDILGTFMFPSARADGALESVTLTVLQDVTILATGQTTALKTAGAGAQEAATARSYNTVTVEVTPREAELLVFAQTVKGRLTLALRNPADMSFVNDLPTINFEHIQKKLPEMNHLRQRDIRHKKDVM